MKKTFLFSAFIFLTAISADAQTASNTYPSSGNVGIGTMSPAAKLDVVGDLFVGNQLGGIGGLYIGQAGYQASLLYDTGSGNLHITPRTGYNTIFTAGNVGIGTTTPARKLDILSGSGVTPLGVVGPNGYVLIDNVGAGYNYFQANVLHQFQGTSNNPIMTLLAGGNVGIGTTSPAFPLDVNGAFHSSVSGGSNLFLSKNTGSSIEFNNGSGTQNAMIEADNSTNRLEFWTNTATNTGLVERMRINNLGNIGIGTTAPRAQLSVVSGTDNNGTFFPAGNALVVGANNALTSNTANLEVSSNSDAAADVGSSIGLGGRFLSVGDPRDVGFAIIKGAKENGTLGNGSGYLAFGTYGIGGMVEKMRIASSGNIGIGTTSPVTTLDVMRNGINGAGLASIAAFETDGKTIGDGMSILLGGRNSSNAQKFYSQIQTFITSPTAGTESASTNFVGLVGGTQTTYMTLTGGNVGIGTTDPGSYKLAVNGSIHSKAVIIDLIGWPDYVFKRDYKLMPLAQVKSYIDRNHHLPEMPTDKEVENRGLDVGEMNKLLTKKVEELTLYLIEKDKREIEQDELIKKMERRLSALEKQ